MLSIYYYLPKQLSNVLKEIIKNNLRKNGKVSHLSKSNYCGARLLVIWVFMSDFQSHGALPCIR